MRKTIKKFAAVGMAAAMVTGALTGCGSNETAATTAAPATEAATTAAGQAADATTAAPAVDAEPAELTIFTMSMPNVEDFDTNDFTLYLEETLNLDLNFVTGTRDDWSDKLNMIMNSDDIPDIIFGVSPDIARLGVKEGIIIPIDQYMTEEYVPNYIKLMNDNGFSMDVCRETDGQIYSMANINDCFHCKYARKMWVNTEYLEQMGKEVPTTTEEFIDVCKAFLEMKPDGIAIGGANSGWFARVQDWLLGAYTFIPTSSGTTKVRDYVVRDQANNNEMVCVAVTDEYKEGLKFMKELYDMGALYDGVFTQTQEQMKTIVNQADEPVLFFPLGTISDAISATDNPELYRKYAPMAPIAGPDGTRIAWTQPNYGVSSGAVCITDACEDLDAAFRFVDFFYGETGDLMSQYGAEEGVDWVLNPEGKKGLSGEPALYEVLNVYSGEAQNHDWQDVGIRVAPESYRLGQAVADGVDPYAADGLELLLFNASKECYEPYAFNTDLIQLNTLKITSEEATDIGTIAVEVNKILVEDEVAFITGQKDIEADWQAHVDAMYAAGLQDILDLYTTAYNR
ncbi:MAG: extracellular solute-binding protein [Lachnospiraceae bacterium]|nr:extracellular solute-binding protein [Lachnospiraceae bacterium]